MWKDDFEGMKRHLNLQKWGTMLLGNVGIKWLVFRTVFLELVERFCPLVWPKRRIAKPWLSRHIGVMQKKKIACKVPGALGVLQIPSHA